MIEAILEFAFKLILGIVCWVIFLPLVYLVATPFILGVTLFQRGSYRENVRAGFRSFWHFWVEWGIFVVPPW